MCLMMIAPCSARADLYACASAGFLLHYDGTRLVPLAVTDPVPDIMTGPAATSRNGLFFGTVDEQQQ
jgi:hypothetical protein